jgi:hypothetical protein
MHPVLADANDFVTYHKLYMIDITCLLVMYNEPSAAPASCMLRVLPRAVHFDHCPSSLEVRWSKMYAHSASTGAASWFSSTCNSKDGQPQRSAQACAKVVMCFCHGCKRKTLQQEQLPGSAAPAAAQVNMNSIEEQHKLAQQQ